VVNTVEKIGITSEYTTISDICGDHPHHIISHEKSMTSVYFGLTYKGLIQNFSIEIHGINGYVQYGFNHGCCNKCGRSNDFGYNGFSRQIDVVSYVGLKYA
jgi:hypothetical protein